MQTIRIAFIGDFQLSDNYPNTKNLLSALRGDDRFDVVSCEGGKSDASRIYRADAGTLSKLFSLVKMVFLALKSVRCINEKNHSNCDVIYVPYPSILVLLCYSIFGRRRGRPLIVVDCFISVYDTVVMDRKVVSEGGVLARLLLRVEKRSLSVADFVLADTTVNAAYLSNLFVGEKEKYAALNLCINETLFRPVSTPSSDSTTVLFVGSFVPLQGVDVVVDAAIRLADRTDIRFLLVGDGQTAAEIESQLACASTTIEWLRAWHSIEEISELYRRADICLGVFGNTNKTYRVLPYKAYMALASGKALISSRVEEGVLREASPPFLTLSTNSPEELASKITELADSNARRARWAEDSRAYYERHLSNDHAVNEFYGMLQSKLS